MKTHGFETISAEAAKDYIAAHKEADYLLVDVRQPQEYRQEHLPGAMLAPLPELMEKMTAFPEDRDLLVYCKSGGRSQAAALMMADQGVTKRAIYNIEGGIMAWNGMTLDGFPRVKAFDRAKTLTEFLETAMNMEKGADRFYREMAGRCVHPELAAFFENLSLVETGHARMLFQAYQKAVPTPPDGPPMDAAAYYGALPGDVMEGGQSLAEALSAPALLAGGDYQDLLDLALEMEFTAFDLYKTLADQTTHDPNLSGMFLDIAQAEKAHIRAIAAAAKGNDVFRP